MITTSKLQRIVLASVLATGLSSVGLAASAQTATMPATSTSNAATTVSLSTTHSRVDRQAELEQFNADVRRIAFRHQGTSL